MSIDVGTGHNNTSDAVSPWNKTKQNLYYFILIIETLMGNGLVLDQAGAVLQTM